MLAGDGYAAEKWALLVGINKYQYDVSPLRYCVANVEAFRQALVNVAGFKPEKDADTCFPKFDYVFFIPLEEVAGKSLFVQFQVAPPSGRRRGQN